MSYRTQLFAALIAAGVALSTAWVAVAQDDRPEDPKKGRTQTKEVKTGDQDGRTDGQKPRPAGTEGRTGKKEIRPDDDAGRPGKEIRTGDDTVRPGKKETKKEIRPDDDDRPGKKEARPKDRDDDDDKDGKGHSAQDEKFVKMASASDLAEINTSRQASTQAASPEVRQFAAKMLADHTKSSQELAAIANKKKIRPAEAMEKKHEAMWRKLLNLKGPDFDRAYMKGQVMAHEAAVDLFETQSKEGQDKELKAFAKKTLPIIQHHLEMAKALHQKLDGKGGGDDGDDHKKRGDAKHDDDGAKKRDGAKQRDDGKGDDDQKRDDKKKRGTPGATGGATRGDDGTAVDANRGDANRPDAPQGDRKRGGAKPKDRDEDR